MGHVVATLAIALSALLVAAPASADARPAQLGDADATASGTAGTTALEPITPCRLFDSRETPDAGRLDARTWRIQVTGRCAVADDARAAAFVVTATGPVAPGFVTVWPAGGSRPLASNLNFHRGNTVANSAVVQLGPGGAVDVYVHAAVDVVIDVTAAFVPAASSTSGRFVPVEPQRLLDTRATGQRAGGELRIPLPAGVPTDAVALAVTVTVVDASRQGYLTVHPSGAPRPVASVVNADGLNRTRANAVFAAVSPDGFVVFRFMPTDVVVDLWGWFTGPSAPDSADGLFVPQAPQRMWDSRQSFDPLHPGGTIERSMAAPGAAIVANVTAVETTRAGFVSVWAAGTARPVVSSLNHRWPSPVAALSVSRLSDRGVAFYAHGGGAHVVVDLAGWFTGQPVAATTSVPANRPPSGTSRVIMVSDSAFAGIRWSGALGLLQGASFDARLESCRRVIGQSCRGREGYAPPNVIDEIRSLPPGYDVAIIAAGYNDFASLFPAGVDLVVREARARGIQRVVWMTHRELVGYRAPGGATQSSTFASHNRALRAAVASGLYPELILADWNTYTANRRWWLSSDGVHLTAEGSQAAAQYTTRTLAALERRPCPVGVGGASTPGGWCARPDVTGPP